MMVYIAAENRYKYRHVSQCDDLINVIRTRVETRA